MKYLFLVSLSVVLFSCSKKATIPTTETMPTINDAYTIIWQGTSKAYKYSKSTGAYNRAESYDYTFEVVQRRYDNVWKSTKTMHRIHPDFGNSKKQNQTMYFEVAFSEVGDSIVAKITSSEGNGYGVTDNEFREQRMNILFDIPAIAPFNTMRLVQHYNYEEGTLIETVEIFKKKKDGTESPFMKIEEIAYIFRPIKMDEAPTKFKK